MIEEKELEMLWMEMELINTLHNIPYGQNRGMFCVICRLLYIPFFICNILTFQLNFHCLNDVQKSKSQKPKCRHDYKLNKQCKK